MTDLGNTLIMSENIQHYLDKKGINSVKLAEDLNINYTTVRNWLQARSYPRIDKVEMMANYFGIEKSDLVERKSDKEKKEEPIDLEELADNENWDEWLSAGGKPISEENKRILMAMFGSHDK